MIYVYKLPEEMSNGFCGSNGHPISFQNVDWFNSIGENGVPEISREDYIEFILGKIYAKGFAGKLLSVDLVGDMNMVIDCTSRQAT